MSAWASTRSAAGFSLFSKHFLEHLLVEREIGYDRLQAPVLILDLFHALDLARLDRSVLPAPAVEGVLADAELAAHLFDLHARARLLEGEGDLLLAELRSLHGLVLRPLWEYCHSAWTSFWGSGHSVQRPARELVYVHGPDP